MQTRSDAPSHGQTFPAALVGDDVAERLATYLAGVPHDLREAALVGYRRVTLALLARRGMAEAAAEAMVEQVDARIRRRLGAIERAGGAAAGRA